MIRLAFSRLSEDGSLPLACEAATPDWLLLPDPGAGSEFHGGLFGGLWGRGQGLVVSPESGPEDGAPTPRDLLTAASIRARALHEGARAVVTGPAMPESLAAAVAMAHFGWADSDYTRIAGAALAGHLLARGPLACGGGAGADWQTLPSPALIDGPIAEIAADGSLAITSREGGGGEVSRAAVIEALVDGIGDPFAFDTPDCRISLADLEVLQSADGRVEVRGAKGSAPEAKFATLPVEHGWRATAMIVYAAPAALEKAYAADRLLRERVAMLGFEVDELHGEFLGATPHTPHVVWRVAARTATEPAARALAVEMAEIVRIGPPGGILPAGAGAPCVERLKQTVIRSTPAGGRQ